MEDIFLKLFNLSIAASWLILAVILFRVIFRNVPKYIRCLLWALVGVRLICPFSIESALSLVPSAQTIPSDIVYSPLPTIDSGITFVNDSLNPILSESLAPQGFNSVNPMQVVMFIAATVWGLGVMAMLVYTVISYLRVRYLVREAVPSHDAVYLCDRVDTPFVFGLIRPRIYLPSAIREQDIPYVIAHEKAHLSRWDHVWKPLGFAILAVHWFNPLVWVAYILLCKDIELACDEKALATLGTGHKKAYAEALLCCSVTHKALAACPLAFGEGGVKGRIRSVLHYKKPAFWAVLVALVAAVAVAVCFLTDPKYSWKSPNYGIKGTTSVAECDDVEFRYIKGSLHAAFPHIEAAWTNNTDDTLIISNEFVLYKGNVEIVPSTDIVWETDSTTLDASRTTTEIYDLSCFDISKSGNYRLEKVFRKQSEPETEYRAFIRFKVDRQYSFLGIEYQGSKIVYDNGAYSSVLFTDDTLPRYTVSETNFHLYTDENADGDTWHDIGELTKVTLTRSVFDDKFGESAWWDSGYSAARLRENNQNAFYVSDLENGRMYYLLEQKNGDIYLAYGLSVPNHIRFVFLLSPAASNNTDSPEDTPPASPSVSGTVSTYDKNGHTAIQTLPLTEQAANNFTAFLAGRTDSTLGAIRGIREYRVSIGEEAYDVNLSSGWINYTNKQQGLLLSADEVKQLHEWLFGYKTAVSYAGYTDDESLFLASLNSERLHFSSVRHLPIYRFESKRELDLFKTQFGDVLDLTHAQEEVPSFETVTAHCDDAFFKDNTLFAVYVSATYSSHHYYVESIYNAGGVFSITVNGNTDEPGDTAVSGWLITVTAPKTLVESCQSFDAVFQFTPQTTETN